MAHFSLEFPADWRPTETATLTLLRRHSQVLLIHKLRGHGAGKVNAPGGRVEDNESPATCARREVHEEVGITVGRLEACARLRFSNTATHDAVLGWVFQSWEFDGTPQATTEAEPFWTDIVDIPYEEMWAGDRYWMPVILGGAVVSCDVLYRGDSFVSATITPLEDLVPS